MDLIKQLHGQMGQDFQPYGGQMVAGMTGGQNQAMDYIRSMLPQNGQGFNSQKLYEGDINKYMDPYIGAALDPALRQIRQQTDLNLNRDDAAAQMAGGFRDTGNALQRSQDKYLGSQAIGDTTAKGYSDAFNQAMANKNLDINRAIQNREDSMRAADQMFGYGTQEQKTNQAGLTADYSEFLRRIGFPMQNIKDIAGTLGSLNFGTPVTQQGWGSSALGLGAGIGSLFF